MSAGRKSHLCEAEAFNALAAKRDGCKGSVLAREAATLRWCEALREGLDLERAMIAALVQHQLWGGLLLAVALHGPGRVAVAVAVDAAIRAWFTRAGGR